jgi:hypothetical protein
LPARPPSARERGLGVHIVRLTLRVSRRGPHRLSGLLGIRNLSPGVGVLRVYYDLGPGGATRVCANTGLSLRAYSDLGARV